MQLHNSFIYNKFVNSLIKKGKKSKIQKLFHKFYYNVNLTLFYGYWYFINHGNFLTKTKLFKKEFLKSGIIAELTNVLSGKKLTANKKKDSFLSLKLLPKNYVPTKSFKTYILNKYSRFLFLSKGQKFSLSPFTSLLQKKPSYNFFFFETFLSNNSSIFYNFTEKLLKIGKSSSYEAWKLKSKLSKNKKFLNSYKSLNKMAYFYSKFSFMQLNFFVSQFLVFQIVYSLLPLMGLRMTAVQKDGKSLKKKGKRRKPYGIPIVLSQHSQITYGLGFFKKSLSSSISKSKSLKKHSFKEVLTDELITFLFFKNSLSLRFKKDLYRRIIDFRSNFHFRWSISRRTLKLKDYLVDKTNSTY